MDPFNTLDPEAFRLYCLNPPDDSCQWGPCPNIDITGLGQQMSMYTSSAVFTIMIIHSPANVRYAWYPYVGNVVALLVSAFASVARTELTQADAAYVILSVASPASLYLWLLVIYTAYRLIRRQPWPTPLAPFYPFEKYVFFSLSFMSFVLWIVLIPVGYAPAWSVMLKQPACKLGLLSVRDNIAWLGRIILVYLILSVIPLLVSFGILRHTREIRTDITHLNAFSSIFDMMVDLKTRFKLWKSFPHLMLLLIQIYPLISYGAQYLILFDVSDVIGIRAAMAGAYTLALVIPYLLSNKHRGLGRVGIFDVAVMVFLLGVGISAVLATRFLLPILPYTFLIHLVGLLCLWSPRAKGEWTAEIISVSIIMTLWHLAAGLEVTYKPGFMLSATAAFNRFVPSFAPWMVTWQLRAYPPAASITKDAIRLWGAFLESSPLWKAVILVLDPMVLWIIFTRMTRPSDDIDFSFGQTYTLLTGVASMSLLIVVAWREKRKIITILMHLNEPQQLITEMKFPRREVPRRRRSSY